MAHSHFVHDLEVVLILVPGPLQVSRIMRTYHNVLAIQKVSSKQTVLVTC